MPEDQQQPDDTGDEQQQPEKTFTADQVTAAVETRLARERAKFADYGDLKRKAAEYEKLAEAAKTDQEKAVEAARREGEAAATQRLSRHMITAEARALAASKRFRDATDAVAFLGDLSTIKIDLDTGFVDTKSLEAALNDLAKNKPYLLVEDKPTRPQGDAGQGPRNGTGGVQDMNHFLHDLANRRP